MSPAPVEDMRRVNAELSLFDSALGRKPQIVAVNKIDLAEVRCKLDEIGEAFRQAGLSVHFISAATGEGVAELMAEAARVLAQVQAEANGMEIVPRKVFRPQPKARRASVRREGDIFIVEAPELERIITTERLSNYEIRGQLKQRLARLGVIKTLEKAGIKPGDKVRCGNLEWEW
jgi:GTP-binding protein